MNSMPTPSTGSSAVSGAGSPSDGPVPGLALPLGGPVNEATTEIPVVVPRDRASGMSILSRVSATEAPAGSTDGTGSTADAFGTTTSDGAGEATTEGADGPTFEAGTGIEPATDSTADDFTAGQAEEEVAVGDQNLADGEDPAPDESPAKDESPVKDEDQVAPAGDAAAEPTMHGPDDDADEPDDEPEDDEEENDDYDNDEYDEEDEDDVDAIDSDVDSDAVAAVTPTAAGTVFPTTGATPGPGDSAAGPIAIWDLEEAEKLRAEWHELKALFVDDPAAAVAQAQILLTTAVQTLAEALLAKQLDLDPRRQAAVPDTESMRVAMRSYRDFLDRLLAL